MVYRHTRALSSYSSSALLISPRQIRGGKLIHVQEELEFVKGEIAVREVGNVNISVSSLNLFSPALFVDVSIRYVFAIFDIHFGDSSPKMFSASSDVISGESVQTSCPPGDSRYRTILEEVGASHLIETPHASGFRY